MAKVVNTKWNFRLLQEHMEKPTGPGVTVPDDTMSLKEILERYTRDAGYLDAMKRRSGGSDVFEDKPDFDSEDVEKLAHLDPVEVDERGNRLAEAIQEGVARRKAELLDKEVKRKQKRDQAKASRIKKAQEEEEATEGSARPTSKQIDPKAGD